MKKVILFFSLTVSSISLSQVKFFINNCQEYDMTWTDSEYWLTAAVPSSWNTPNLLTIPPTITDMVLVQGVDPVAHGNCTMDMACNGSASITNSGALNGKIAVIRRGNCAFGTKVLAVQNAGAAACIIINGKGGEIPISGGIDGPNVTIPTIVVGSETGKAICDAINSGTAIGFIGNINGYYSNNLYISNQEAYIANRSQDVAHVYTPTNSTGVNHQVKPGVLVHNYGSSNQNNVVVTCDISVGGALVYTQSSSAATIASGNDLWVEFPLFNNVSETNQTFKLSYSVSSSLTDDTPCDNQFSTQFSISPNQFSYALVDSITHLPHLGGGFQLGNFNDSVLICNHFVDSNASFLAAKGISFSAYTYDPFNSFSEISFKTVNVEVFEWEAQNNIYDLTNGYFTPFLNDNTFTRLASESYFYVGDYQDSLITVNFTNGIPLNDNKHYLFCTSVYSQGDPSIFSDVYFRTDDSYNYKYNIGLSTNAGSLNNGNPTTVIIRDGDFYSRGAGLDKPSSMIVNFSDCFVSKVDTISSCTPYTWIDGNTYNSSTNSAYYTFNNLNGCDSIVRLDLAIQSNQTTDFVTTCQNAYTWIDGNTYTNNNNTATYTYQNIYGCDSIVTLGLTFYTISSTDVIVSCDEITWIDGNTYTNDNFTATYTFFNGASNGCDSVIILNYNRDVISAGVSYYDNTIHAVPPIGYNYQWVDCDNGYTPIIGATNSTYSPMSDGNYAVIVSNSNCSDTSNCLAYYVGLNNYGEIGFELYPNPANSQINIDFNDKSEYQIIIYNVQGETVYQNVIVADKFFIDIYPFNPGVYFIQINSEKGIRTEKIIITR